MRPQRKIMMVETTHAFVKLKQLKAAVSAGGIIFFQSWASSCIDIDIVDSVVVVITVYSIRL